MTIEEAIKILKNNLCKNCGVYLGGGKCKNNCMIFQSIETLKNTYKDAWEDLRFEVRSLLDGKNQKDPDEICEYLAYENVVDLIEELTPKEGENNADSN